MSDPVQFPYIDIATAWGRKGLSKPLVKYLVRVADRRKMTVEELVEEILMEAMNA